MANSAEFWANGHEEHLAALKARHRELVDGLLGRREAASSAEEKAALQAQIDALTQRLREEIREAEASLF